MQSTIRKPVLASCIIHTDIPTGLRGYAKHYGAHYIMHIRSCSHTHTDALQHRVASICITSLFMLAMHGVMCV